MRFGKILLRLMRRIRRGVDMAWNRRNLRL